MYFHPKDGYPDLKHYKGFSVGDIVHQKNQFYSTTLGHIVRIYEPPFDKHPYIAIEWFGNGAVGVHSAENLVLYRTRAQWIAEIEKDREQKERDKARGKELLDAAKAQRARDRAKKTFNEFRKKKS